MLLVVLVFVALFLAGFCLVALPRGVGQIVVGFALLLISATIAAVPEQPAQPAAEPPGHTFTMHLTAP
jgi:hypothetical protein